MLYIVLALVLAALGLLVTALITANSLWAWISIGLSVLAGASLVADWLTRRSQSPADEALALPVGAQDDEKFSGELPEDEDSPVEVGEETELLSTAGDLDSSTAVVEPSTDTDEDENDDAGGDGGQPEQPPARSDEQAAPGEERTDPADLVTVVELDDEVLVVDEYPRYHLTACPWLWNRDTIPIAVSEARQLGFTPCARCGPDATLSARRRAG